jgi:hypothetical protein
MMIVNSHAAPKPTTSTQTSHDAAVGRGSPACHLSKAKAASTETAHWAASILVTRIRTL